MTSVGWDIELGSSTIICCGAPPLVDGVSRSAKTSVPLFNSNRCDMATGVLGWPPPNIWNCCCCVVMPALDVCSSTVWKELLAVVAAARRLARSCADVMVHRGATVGGVVVSEAVVELAAVLD